MNIIQHKDCPFDTPSQVPEDYTLSAFCIREPLEEGCLLCSTLTGALVQLTDEEELALRSGGLLTGQWAENLAAMGFLRKKNTDEYALVEEARAQARKKQENTGAITSYTILPTSCCNARCFYCYESGIPQKTMSRETARDVAAYILRHSQGEKIHLGWFGGEPTTAHPVITLICGLLRQQGANFESGMISNGLLLDKALVVTAREQWNLKHVQITLDGTRQVYNETKNYKCSPPSPFDTVLANIGHLLEAGIRVSVRINLGSHNFEDSTALIRELSDRFSGKKGFRAYVHEIDNLYTPEEYERLTDKTFELNDLLVQLKLQEPQELPSLRLHSCMADNDRSVVINPEGSLGKCEHFVFEKLHGSIYRKETDQALLEQWKEPVRFPQCSSCPLYPTCLRLNWCNGGSYYCAEGQVLGKLSQIRRRMRQMYDLWSWKKLQFRERDSFYLTGPYELIEETEGPAALFPPQGRRQDEVIIPVNQTALDILTLLQQPQTFREITTMLEETYDTTGFDLEDIVENYLLDLLREGLCNITHNPGKASIHGSDL